jgi:hypothetical protein
VELAAGVHISIGGNIEVAIGSFGDLLVAAVAA